MKKFEYNLIKIEYFQELYETENDLNNQGEFGWELVGIEFGCFIFKREIKDES